MKVTDVTLIGGPTIVSLGPTLFVPSEFRATFSAEKCDTFESVQIDVQVDATGAKITWLAVEARKKDSIQSQNIRRISFPALITQAVQAAALPLAHPEAENVITDGKRPVFDPARLPELARIYQDAVKAGRHPSIEVMTKLNMSRASSTRWIKRARDEGLIPPARGTSPLQKPTKEEES